MAEPLWLQIKHELAADLAAARYRPGERLPSEAALAQRFRANRHTVRRALATLSEEGAIHIRQGAGATVTLTPVTYRVSERTRFRQSLAADGRTASQRLVRLETLPAEPPEAEALAVAPGEPVHLVEMVGEADGLPISFGSSRFPAKRLPGLPASLRASGSVTAALAGEGIADYQRLWTRMSAERAPALIARHLQIAAGSPALRTVSLNVDGDGRPVEYGQGWFSGDRVQLIVERDAFRRTDS